MLLRGKSYGNDTIDVFNKNCFSQYNTCACLRSVTLAVMASITVLFIALKIYRYHAYKHKQIQHYAIFYAAGIEMIVCISSFMIGHKYPQLKFSANFLKLIKFTIICHLHWTSTARIHNKENIIQHVINPGLSLYVIYCTAVALMGMVDVGKSWSECLKPYWLMLSLSDFIAVQCFAFAALYIMHITNSLPALVAFKSAQKKDLLTVVIAYELSAFFSLIYDAVVKLVGTEEIGCSAVFGHSQFLYSITEFIFNIGKFLLPIWAILVVFKPMKNYNSTSNGSIPRGYSLDGTSNSNHSSIKGFHQYHKMSVPSSLTSSGNALPSNDTHLHQMENSSTTTNLITPFPNSSNGFVYTNQITWNSSPLEENKFTTNLQNYGLTAISEESNINIMETLERVSVRSEKSTSSHY